MQCPKCNSSGMFETREDFQFAPHILFKNVLARRCPRCSEVEYVHHMFGAMCDVVESLPREWEATIDLQPSSAIKIKRKLLVEELEYILEELRDLK